MDALTSLFMAMSAGVERSSRCGLRRTNSLVLVSAVVYSAQGHPGCARDEEQHSMQRLRFCYRAKARITRAMPGEIVHPSLFAQDQPVHLQMGSFMTELW
jgi:hypothetical protein